MGLEGIVIPVGEATTLSQGEREVKAGGTDHIVSQPARMITLAR